MAKKNCNKTQVSKAPAKKVQVKKVQVKRALNAYQQSLVENNVEYIRKMVYDITVEVGINPKENKQLYSDIESMALATMVELALRYNRNHAQCASFITFCTPYIKGMINYYFFKKSRGICMQGGAWQKVTFVSLDKQLGDDDDIYTLADTIAAPFEEEENAYDAAEILDIIKASLKGANLRLFKKLARNNYDVAATVKELAAKQGVSKRYIYMQMQQLFGTMRGIAHSKGLTINI